MDMKYNLPDRVFRELSSFAQAHSVKKSYCLVRGQEGRIQKEVI